MQLSKDESIIVLCVFELVENVEKSSIFGLFFSVQKFRGLVEQTNVFSRTKHEIWLDSVYVSSVEKFQFWRPSIASLNLSWGWSLHGFEGFWEFVYIRVFENLLIRFTIKGVVWCSAPFKFATVRVSVFGRVKRFHMNLNVILTVTAYN